ncbi:MAG: RHS repeat-associated core domain-containing protein [Bacilli bacterium]|nr:RHS repeat-associated core domain-containing protein [Bacilli bacterium]
MIYYLREVNNKLLGFKYNNDMYYYLKNGMEDIIGILDDELNLIVNYEYDSWGKVVSVKDNNGIVITDQTHIGHINPFRYRSYYYDTETGLYYLNSRYYNPEWGRFINEDKNISTEQGFICYNMYVYTENNPICRTDSSGGIWFHVAGAVIGGLSSFGIKIISNISSGNTWYSGTAGAFANGAIAGFIVTTPFGLKAAGIATASYGSSLAESLVEQLLSNNGVSLSAIIWDTAINGTIDFVLGSVIGDVYKINKGWYRPQKISTSFAGNYTRKLTVNTIVSDTYTQVTTAALDKQIAALKSERDKIIKKIEEINDKLSKLTDSNNMLSGEGYGGGFSGGAGKGGGGGGGGRF